MRTSVLVIVVCAFVISCAAFAQDQSQLQTWNGKVNLSQPAVASEAPANSQALTLQFSPQYLASTVWTTQTEPTVMASNSPCLAMRTYMFKREAGSADETHPKRERTCTPASKFKLVPAK